MDIKNYVDAQMEVIMFDTQDVITTSTDPNPNGGGVELPDDEW